MSELDVTQQLLVVPRRPGPLIELPQGRTRDEIDDVLDDLFGTPTHEGPGLFDAVLVVGGAGLATAAVVADLPRWLLVVGVAAVVFGFIMPLHALFTRAARARSVRRVRNVMEQGTPLDVSHPECARLTTAYRRIESHSAAQLAPEALEIAHLALIEAADVLRGRPPQGPAETRYVAERASALESLARSLERPETSQEPAIDEEAVRDSAVQAVRDLDERTGGGSLAQVEVMRRLLDEGERPHGNS